MLDDLRATIHACAMLEPGDIVVVGCSGGADSVSLLHGLCTLRGEFSISITAAHINHGLRGSDSDADEAFVAEICNRLGVPFDSFRADVRGLKDAEGISLEDAARRLRYRYLREAQRIRGAQKIAVAHNRDDNAETVLMHLLRGAGMKGLCGIPPVNGAVVRPLINTPRSAIERYLSEQGLPFRTDLSNDDPAFTRNRIRRFIIPAIQTHIVENAAEIITRSAALIADDECFLSEAAVNALEDCMAAPDITASDIIPPDIPHDTLSLDILKVKALPRALTRRVIREVCRRVNGDVTDLSAAHTQQILSLLDKPTGRVIQLPHGLRVKRVYKKLCFTGIGIPYPEKPHANLSSFAYSLAPDQDIPIPGTSRCVRMSLTPPPPDFTVRYGCTKEFRYDTISGDLTLRTRRPGDFIYFDGLGRRKLQDYFTDCKIPRELRDTIPLLANGSEILWIMDSRHRVNGRYKPDSHSASLWVTLFEPDKGVSHKDLPHT